MMRSSIQCQQYGTRGFSLVQLLACIAIILILMTILFSAVGRIRAEAMTSKCRNNLRQLATAGMLYASDNEGRMPDRTAWTYPVPNPYSLASYLDLPPRVGGERVYVDTVLSCPATLDSTVYMPTTEYYRSYSINQYSTGGDNSSGNNAATWADHVGARGISGMLTAVAEPSLQAFFMDGTGSPVDGGFNYSVFTAPDRLKSAPNNWRTTYIHGDAINVVYMDGHIESLDRQYAEAELVGATNPSGGASSPRVKPFWGALR